MSAHPNLITVSAAVVTVAAGGVLARARIRYWKQWGLALFDNFADSIGDRLDVDLDLERLAP